MPVKIENQYEGKLPRNTIANIEGALDSVPREHLRGIERVRLVDVITEPRARMAAKGSDLPGLYHPRQGNQGAWFEVALTFLDGLFDVEGPNDAVLRGRNGQIHK